jgi:HK97 family phage major capsid protein
MRNEFLERTGKAVLEERYQIFQEMQAAVKDAEAQGRAPNEREKAAWHRAANRYEELSLELAQVQQIERARDPESRAPLNYGVIGDLMKAAYNFGTERFSPDMRRSFDVTSGSAIVQDPRIQSEFFETFKANNPLADLGARFITGENYSQFPVQTADPSVVWFEEGDSALTPDSAATIGSVKIEYKVPAMLLLASNFWLEDTSRLGSEIIGRMAVSTLQEAVIKAVLNGTSAAKQPVGLDSITGVQSVDGANAVLADYSKIVQAVRKLLDANVQLPNIGAIIPPIIWEQLNLLADQNDQPLMLPAGIRDLPMYVSSAVRTDYAVGEDETKIYLGDWSNMLIQIHGGGPRAFVLREKYADTFQTGFLLNLRMDMQVVRPNAFCRIDDILTA